MFKFKSAPDALFRQHGIDNYFSIQKFAFKCMGIDITSEQNTVFNPILTGILIGLMMIINIFMLNYVVENREDLHLATRALTPFWQSMLVLIKMCYFLCNKKKIVKLVRQMWLWNLKATGDEFQIILEANKRERFYSQLFLRYVLATVTVSLLSPLLISYFYYLKGYGFMDTLDLPSKTAYHAVVNPKSYNGHLFAYFMNTVSAYVIFNGSVANDTLFSWCAYNVSAQFRILSLRFKTTSQNFRPKSEESSFMKTIISHVEYHQRIIELVDYFNDVFMMTVFLKYTVSLLQIAFLLFQIVRFSELSDMVFHIFFLMTVALQLMMYCRGGQMVIDQSTAIALTIYENFKWHAMSEESKKLLLLPMMRAQKRCILTGIFFKVDLSLFLWVFKTSVSFFTMLKSLES